MVGRHRVAEHGNRAGSVHVLQRRWALRHAVEVRRLLDVLRFRIPGVTLAGRNIEAAPVLVAIEHVSVLALEHLLADARGHRFGDLVVTRPNLREVDRTTVAADPQWLAG